MAGNPNGGFLCVPMERRIAGGQTIWHKDVKRPPTVAGHAFESIEEAIHEQDRLSAPAVAGLSRSARLVAAEVQDDRLVYWSAWRFLAAERSLCRAFGYEEASDIERIRAMIANDLRRPVEEIDPHLAERALRDAIRDFMAS